MRNEQLEQWALVVRPAPPLWPYEETLVFPRLPAVVDNELLALARDDVGRVLLQLTAVYELESHNLAGDVHDLTARRWLNVSSQWLRVGFEAGLGHGRPQMSLGLPRVSP
jgi:hypothetical protein